MKVGVKEERKAKLEAKSAIRNEAKLAYPKDPNSSYK
jgi:hypothetical protein